MTAIFKYRKLSTSFSSSPLKDVKTSFIKELCCRIASYRPSNLLPPETFCFTSTVSKTHHEPVIASFSVQI